MPLLPFNMLNYLLSVTPVGIKEYVLATWLGMMVRISYITSTIFLSNYKFIIHDLLCQL